MGEEEPTANSRYSSESTKLYEYLRLLHVFKINAADRMSDVHHAKTKRLLRFLDMFALLCVQQVKGEVIACYAHRTEKETTLYISGNHDISEATKRYIANIISICQDMKKDDSAEARSKKINNLAKLVVKHCRAKILKRARRLLSVTIDRKVIKSKWQTSRDDILEAAASKLGHGHYDKAVEAELTGDPAEKKFNMAYQNFELLTKYLNHLRSEGPRGPTTKTVLLLTETAAKIHQSHFANVLLQFSHSKESEKAVFYIRKLAAYDIAITTLANCMKNNNEDQHLFMDVKFIFLKNEPLTTMKTRSWGSILKEDFGITDATIQKIRSFKADPTLSEVEINRSAKLMYDLSDVEEEKMVQLPIHAELNIVQALASNDIWKGEIGVSKLCCVLCYKYISALTGFRFAVTGTHGKFYDWAVPRSVEPQTAAVFRQSKYPIQTTKKLSEANVDAVRAVFNLLQGNLKQFCDEMQPASIRDVPDSDLSSDEEFGGPERAVGSKYESMESDSEDES